MSDFSKIFSDDLALKRVWNHAERLKLQNVVRAILPQHRAAACLRHRLGGSAVSVGLTREGRTRLGGVMVCDAHHICPVCHHTKMQKDKQSIMELVRHHYADGGWLIDAVFTIPHHENETLQAVLIRLEAVWREFRTKKIWKRIESELGIVGVVRRLEVTLGPNGWHPHLHVSMMCDPWDATELRATTRNLVLNDAFAILCSSWAQAGKKQGLSISMYAQSAVALVAGVDGEKAVAYNLKNMGYADKEHSFTPMDLLRICNQKKDSCTQAAKRLFTEYAKAIQGKHVISRIGKARTVAGTQVQQSSTSVTPLGRLSPEAWCKLLGHGLREKLFRVRHFEDLQEVVQQAAALEGLKTYPLGWLWVPSSRPVVKINDS